MSPDQEWSEEHETLALIMGLIAHFAVNRPYIDQRELREHLVNAFHEVEDALILLDRIKS